MVILLTYGPSAVSKLMQYNHLLDTWFPAEIEKAPKGFLVDTSEEALLIPDWLKLRMIRSHVPRLVEAALTDLDIGQLILFIQSFGIPIASMSKLLATLDAAVLTDKEAVGEAVIDKAYMVQLVEVQHRRGAKGGETFTRVLDLLDTHKSTPMEVEQTPTELEKIEKKPRVKQEYLSDKDGIAAADRLFSVQVTGKTSIKQMRELFQRLQRTLVYEMSRKKEGSLLVKEVMRFLLKRASSDRSFVSNILSRPQYSCPLFRLFTSLNPKSATLTQLAQIILGGISEVNHSKPLKNILSNYVENQENRSRGKVENMIIEEEATDALTDAMQKLLVKSGPTTGHLVDKLVRLEPEILGTSVDMQMRLLFSATETERLEFRPYLLTFLTHHASWKTLSHCVSRLMEPDAVKRYDPTSVLDFLRALTCNPKLWQGREKHTPKHYCPEDVLNLSEAQLKRMTDYIVAEAVGIGNNEVLDGKTLDDKIIAQMTLRLQLLTQCIRATDIQTAIELAKHLIMRAQNTKGHENHMCNKLLVQLYLKIPSLNTQLGHSDMNKVLDSYSSLSVNGCSVMDVLSHTLLTALASSSNTKDWSKRSQEIELAVRKMSAVHPLLVLRQLPLIASALRGRVELDWAVFKSRNHLLFFQQISNLLDLLQPSIFQPEYQQALHKTLDSYVELFQYHGRESGVPLQAIGALVTHFVSFVQGYIKCNAKNAQKYLQSQAQVISELQSEYPILGNLCVVISGLKGGLEVIVTPNSTAEQPNPQWDDKVAQLSKEDPVGSLMFLDYGSSKRPSLLAPLIGTLCPFLVSPIQQVRNCAHSMVVRYLRHNPKAASDVLPAYMSCLDSSNPDVIMSALEKLPEVVVCSQELALPLLQRVFTLGIRSSYNTGPAISKAITLLNLQGAC